MITLSEIIPSVLNALVDGRVYENATPMTLARGNGGVTLPFILWFKSGGQDGTYIDQTRPDKRHARITVCSYSPDRIECEQLCEDVCNALLASIYTVGVYGSPVGAYDADRQLQGLKQPLSIWFQPNPS